MYLRVKMNQVIERSETIIIVMLNLFIYSNIVEHNCSEMLIVILRMFQQMTNNLGHAINQD